VECPANHRELAYGGDPSLDRVRAGLTFRVLRRHAPDAADVFEIGYGSGELLGRFLRAGCRVAGADAEQLGVRVDPLVASQGRLSTGGIEALDPAGYDVDLVYGVHVIEHVDDVSRTLRTAHDLLRPGGALQLLTPAADSSGLRWFGAHWWLLEDPTHVRFFSAESLLHAARAAGFEQPRVRRLWADNATMEGASLARMARPAPRAAGVLSDGKTLAWATATTPVALAARAVVPRMRPTLHLVARKSDR
jgi:2-polyprenyl-3-methyl-5-hydroxy-6-metoxy-1,4-benzoquinol methylase